MPGKPKSSATDAEAPHRRRGLPLSPKGNRIVGVFRRKEAGFGFVRPTAADRGDGERIEGSLRLGPEEGVVLEVP